jgi:transposase
MWQKAISLFLSYYDPCNSVEESTHQFTTPQLVHMLQQHSGVEIITQDVIDILTDQGYKYDYTSELNFEWLFKQKSVLS